MSGGGGKSTRKVYDFLMSMDYGLCHGPIDTFNKIWVKDKPIWCGDGRTNQTVTVNLPDLFGGDDAEGGCVGKVELYLGDFTQVSSDQLASRVGRTSETMPGYRGIAHAFFRGSGTGKGFRWTTNNPYLPPMKASLTRIPTTLNTGTSVIPPIVGFDSNGDIIQSSIFVEGEGFFFSGGLGDYPALREDTMLAPEVFNPVAVNLYDLGLTPEQIAEGDIKVYVAWNVHIQEDSLDIEGDFDLEVRFYGESDAPLDFALSPLAVHTHNFSGEGEFNEIELMGVAPTGTQWVTIRSRYWSVDSPFPDFLVDEKSVAITTGDDGKSTPGFTAYAEPVSDFDTDTPEWVDLYDYFPQQVIDAGLVSIQADWTLHVGLSPTGDNPTTTDLNLYFFPAKTPFPEPIPPATTVPPEEGADIDNEIIDEPSNILVYAPSGAAVSTITKVVPAGTRYIAVRGGVAVLFPLFQIVIKNEKTVTLNGPSLSFGHCDPNGTLGLLPDANPAHIIHECLVNEEWGDGQSSTRIDQVAFETAAQTLYDEGFGLSILWVEQDKIKNIIQEILDHIQAFLFIDPETGLWTLKLLRADYDEGTLDTLDPTNCQAENRKRRAWGETINQIDVSYTDPDSEKPAGVSAHDGGNIAMQGRISSDKRDYYGVRNPFLAQILADRDVTESATPLFSCQIKVDRSQWKIKPGDVKKFVWPEDGITDMIVRIMSVDYGNPKDRTITLLVTEDIFAFETTTYDAPQGSLWTAGEANPEPLDAEMPFTAPAPIVLRGGITLTELDDNYPSVAVTLLGSKDDAPRPIDVAVWAEGTDPTGGTIDEKIATVDEAYSVLLTEPLVQEVRTVLPDALVSSLIPEGGVAGDWLVIGSSEALQEIVMLETYDSGLAEWTVVRGIWDTVPLNWAAGDRIWAMPDALLDTDNRDRAAGELMNYRFLPRTGTGRLAFADATPVAFTATERPHLPFRPANAQIDSFGFEPAIYNDPGSKPTDLTFTWATRNRTTEDQLVLDWDDADATPEAGQTTVLRFYDAAGDFDFEITGLAGSSHVVSVASLGSSIKGEVEFLSEKAGMRSRTGARRAYDLSSSGYGYSYGLNYGGAEGYGWDYGGKYGN